MIEISKEACIDFYKQKIENWFLLEVYIWGVGTSQKPRRNTSKDGRSVECSTKEVKRVENS